MDLSRRRLLAACLAGAAMSVAFPALAGAAARRRRPGDHPTPRPGITGVKVLAGDALADLPRLVPLFDAVREHAAIVDGIRCHCGCAGLPGFHSLLSCYEADGMARFCPICEGEGRLATRMIRQGRTLDEIRTAIDAQFG